MNRLLQIAVVGSVSLCLLSGVLLHRWPPAPPPRPDISLASWLPPAHPYRPDVVLQGLSPETTPFTPRFFETMAFKGMVRRPFGDYAAVFFDHRGRTVFLTAESSHDGVTLVSADGQRCVVRAGTQLREFVATRHGR